MCNGGTSSESLSPEMLHLKHYDSYQVILMLSISLFLSKIPLTPKRLPEDEQMLETRKEGVTEMTSFEAGTYSRLEQIQNFVSSENPASLCVYLTH